jgi:hypothetical protein
MTEHAPFTGEYPTKPEIEQALTEHGFGAHADTVIKVPMDGSSGPLAEELTRCRSVNLTGNWPHMFKVVVGAMVREAEKG